MAILDIAARREVTFFVSNEGDVLYTHRYILVFVSNELKTSRKGDTLDFTTKRTTRSERFKTPSEALCRINELDELGQISEDQYNRVYTHVLDLQTALNHHSDNDDLAL